MKCKNLHMLMDDVFILLTDVSSGDGSCWIAGYDEIIFLNWV